MNPERWHQIEQLYCLALERETAEREGFLMKACQGDADLRREVESLLEQSGSTGALADRGAWAALHDLASAQTTLKTMFHAGTDATPFGQKNKDLDTSE